MHEINPESEGCKAMMKEMRERGIDKGPDVRIGCKGHCALQAWVGDEHFTIGCGSARMHLDEYQAQELLRWIEKFVCRRMY